MARMGFGGLAGVRTPRGYKSAAHYQAAMRSRGDVMHYGGAGGATIVVDMREVGRLVQALQSAGKSYKQSHGILAQSFNRAGRQLKTKLKRAIQGWTGIKRQAAITKRMTPIVASGSDLRAGVRVGGRHFRITKADFGARWKRPWPGVRHSAWGRGQTAKGAFMPKRFGGSGAYGGGLAFKRTSSKRYPIAPLWGPNPVREMQRHEGEVKAMLAAEAKWLTGEMARRARLELAKAKARYGV